MYTKSATYVTEISINGYVFGVYLTGYPSLYNKDTGDYTGKSLNRTISFLDIYTAKSSGTNRIGTFNVTKELNLQNGIINPYDKLSITYITDALTGNKFTNVAKHTVKPAIIDTSYQSRYFIAVDPTQNNSVSYTLSSAEHSMYLNNVIRQLGNNQVLQKESFATELFGGELISGNKLGSMTSALFKLSAYSEGLLAASEISEFNSKTFNLYTVVNVLNTALLGAVLGGMSVQDSINASTMKIQRKLAKPASPNILDNIVLALRATPYTTKSEYTDMISTNEKTKYLYTQLKSYNISEQLCQDMTSVASFTFLPKNADDTWYYATGTPSYSTDAASNTQVCTIVDDFICAVPSSVGVPREFVTALKQAYTFSSVWGENSDITGTCNANGVGNIEHIFGLPVYHNLLNSMRVTNTDTYKILRVRLAKRVTVVIDPVQYSSVAHAIDESDRFFYLSVLFGNMSGTVASVLAEQKRRELLSTLQYDEYTGHEYRLSSKAAVIKITGMNCTPNIGVSLDSSTGAMLGDYTLCLNGYANDPKQLKVVPVSSTDSGIIVAANNMVLFKSSRLGIMARNISNSDSNVSFKLIPVYNSKLAFDTDEVDDTDNKVQKYIFSEAELSSGDASDYNVLMSAVINGNAYKQLLVNDVATNLVIPSDRNTHVFFSYYFSTKVEVSNEYNNIIYIAMHIVQGDSDGVNGTDVLLMKLNTLPDNQGKHTLSMCNAADLQTVFTVHKSNKYTQPQERLGFSSGMCAIFNSSKYTIDVPVSTKDSDGNILHSDTYTFKASTDNAEWVVYNQKGDQSTNDTPVIDMSVIIQYVCNCIIPQLFINAQETHDYTVYDNNITFTCNGIPTTLRMDTGLLEYIDDIFTLSTNNGYIQGTFEYMKYCVLSSILKGVYKVSTADNAKYTVHSSGIIDDNIDFTVEELDE